LPGLDPDGWFDDDWFDDGWFAAGVPEPVAGRMGFAPGAGPAGPATPAVAPAGFGRSIRPMTTCC
jgi:hypothetical protein